MKKDGDRHARPRIVAIVNQKGGVGKTTTAINLATAFAAVGRRVLIVDADSQGNASTGLGIEQSSRVETTYDLLGGRNVTPIQTEIPGLTIIPATADLSGAEVELVATPDRQNVLKASLETVAAGNEFVLIDCPPSLSLMTLNALVAANEVLVPMQCEFFALEGLSLLLDTVERVSSAHNPGLCIAGIVLTMFDRRNRLSHEVAADVRRVMGDVVYRTMIPRNVRVSEAPSFGKPVMLYDITCPGAQAYVHLAGEFLRRHALGKRS